MAWVCLCGRGRPSGPRSPPRAQAARRRTYGTTWRGPAGPAGPSWGGRPDGGSPPRARTSRWRTDGIPAPSGWAGHRRPPATGAQRPGTRGACRRIDSTLGVGQPVRAGAAARDGGPPPWGASRPSAYRQLHSAWADLSGWVGPGGGRRFGRELTALGRETPVGVPTAPLGVGRAGRRRPPRPGSSPRARAARRSTDSTTPRGPAGPPTETATRNQTHRPRREPPVSALTAPLGVDRPARPGWAG